MGHRNLLVVEDDDGIRGLLVEYFAQHAIDVDAARDGAEALHQIHGKQYDVIVLDLMMPHMSGIDFLSSLEALRSDPSVKQTEHTPAVLVITSAPQESVPSTDIENRFPSIVRGVLRKPLDMPVLAGRVEALL